MSCRKRLNLIFKPLMAFKAFKEQGWTFKPIFLDPYIQIKDQETGEGRKWQLPYPSFEVIVYFENLVKATDLL